MKTQFMKALLLVGCLTATSLLHSAPTLSDINVVPMSPWGFAAECTVSGAGTEDLDSVYCIESFFESTCRYGTFPCLNGVRRVGWNLAAKGITKNTTTGSVSLQIYGPYPTYCVIDLSGGPETNYYPVTYLSKPPKGGFNTEEFKTTKLVLKRVDAGTFTMGAASESDNPPHTVILTQPFYLGIYEMTQKQWALVMGSDSITLFKSQYGKGDAYPVCGVNHDGIRGHNQWPKSKSVTTTSFLGKLRERTNLNFDLPTEAQWEYACRAGTTTTWSFGDDSTKEGDYMWVSTNAVSSSSSSSIKTHEVGLKKPNPWGFYDMYGMAYEICLDWYTSAMASDTETDPKGSVDGYYRVIRGSSASSADRLNQDIVNSSLPGFRLAWTLP